MGELAPRPIKVEEKLSGRVNFIGKILGFEPTTDFMRAPLIDFGKHEQAEHRTNLVIVAMNFAATEAMLGGDLKGILDNWVQEPELLLEDELPLKYLGTVEPLSTSLWLSSAANVLTRMPSILTDSEAAEIMSLHRDTFDFVEQQYKSTAQ